MYQQINPSPNRTVRLPSQLESVRNAFQDRSRSPNIQNRSIMNVSPSSQNIRPGYVNPLYHNRMNNPNPTVIPAPNQGMIPHNVNIIGNLQPPPGMQTFLKPKIFEAVDVPANNMNSGRPQSSLQIYTPPQQSVYYSEPDPQRKFTQQALDLPKQGNQPNDDDDFQNQKYLQKVREVEELNREKQFLQDQMRQITDNLNQQIYNNQQKSTEDFDHQLRDQKHQMEEQKQILIGQCEQYFQKYQRSEQEKQEMENRLKQLESMAQKVPHLQQDVGELCQKRDHLINEIQIWKQKYNQSEEDRIKQIEHIKDDYERAFQQQFEGLRQSAQNKCRILEEEMEKNRDHLNEAIRDAEQWRAKYHQEDLDKLSYTQRNQQLELQALHQQKDIDRLTLSSLQKQQEIESLRQRVNQLEYNHVQILQPSLETELRRLREQMEARNKELSDLRKRNHELEQYCVKMKEIEVEYDILKSKHQDLEKAYQESTKFKYLFDQLQHEFSQQSQNFQKSENQVTELKRNEYRYQQEIQRLSELIRVKDDEFGRQGQDYKKNMLNLQNQVNQFKDQYERELAGVQSAKNKSEKEFRDNLERKFNLMREELENLKKEREILLQTCSQLSQTKVQLENKIVLLTGEIERLNQVIRAKYEEQQHLKENNRVLNERIDQTESQCDELKKENEIWKSRVRDPTSSFKNSQPRYDQKPYEQSHAGSLSRGYESQRPSQKNFDIPSHQQDFN